MGDDGFHGDGWHPHDGEGKIGSCPGPGCDCDEKNYGYRGGKRGNSTSGKGVWTAFIIALILGYGVNETLGVIIMLGVIFYLIVS